MPVETLQEVLERAARSDRGVCFVDRGERDTRLSYAALRERAHRFAGGLQALGIRPDDRIGIVLPTGPAFFDAFFGSVLAGAVPVPLYPPVRLGRLEEYHARTAAMLRTVRARLVCTDARTRRVLGPAMLRALPDLGCIVAAEVGEAARGLPAADPSAAAFIQFSSGTTSDPKPILLSHRAVCANVAAILSSILAVHPESSALSHVCVSWLPLYHDMGLVGAVLSAMAHPAELVLIPPEQFVARPALWLRAIARHRGTISPAPNFAYALCADRVRDDELEGIDLSSWRVAMNGAEPVTASVLERFVRRFADHGLRPESLTPVYGLAEATLAVTFSDLRRPFGRQPFDRDALVCDGVARPCEEGTTLISLGRPLPGFCVRIRDDSGCELEEGRLGRVHVRGPSLMQGYDGRLEATQRVLRDGWLDTGDVGFLFKDELYLFGRAKDVIVLRGRNHAPQDVEQAADEVPGVRVGCTAAVGRVGDRGEELVLFAECSTRVDEGALTARLEQRVLKRTGLVLSQVFLLAPGTLPRTSSGKIRRAETLRLHEAGALRPPDPINPWRLARAMLRSARSFARLRWMRPVRLRRSG